MSNLLFHLFAAITVISAAGVVFNRNAVSSAMCLLLCLAGVTGLFVLLDAFLLAVLLILVYAGAVVALFLFIVMLLDMQGGVRQPFRRSTVAAATLAGALLLMGVVSFARHAAFAPAAPGSNAPVGVVPIGASLKLYADLLFTTYLLPVEVVGFLLLVAMLGVIVLSKKFEHSEGIE